MRRSERIGREMAEGTVNALRVPVQTHVRHGPLGLWAFGLSMAGSLLTAVAVLGAVGSGGSSRFAAPLLLFGPSGDPPLPTAHPMSHMQ